MHPFATLLVAFILAACGASDSGTTSTDSDSATPPVGAMGHAAGRQPVAAPAVAAQVDPKVQSCLALVRQASYRQALPACAAALEIEPDNLELRHAADKARAEAARETAAGLASPPSAEETAGAAAGSSLGSATGAPREATGQTSQ
ncbi:MAG: hypothetical protein ACE5IL_07015 [Myxococcota bacterium]